MSNRKKYRSGSGYGSANFIFKGPVRVTVQPKLFLPVRFGFGFLKIVIKGSGFGSVPKKFGVRVLVRFH